MLFLPLISFSQVIYHETCSTECGKCKSKNPMKVEYKADPQKNVVFRIIGDTSVDKLDNCTVINKDNWVCEGISRYSDLGKQSAANGVASWISSAPPSKGSFNCIFDKNFLGNFNPR